HSGRLGDAPYGRLLVPALGELLAGHGQDAVAGVGGLRTGSAATAPSGRVAGLGHGLGTLTAEARCRRVKASASARSASRSAPDMARRVLTSMTTWPSKPVRARRSSSSAQGWLPRPG